MILLLLVIFDSAFDVGFAFGLVLPWIWLFSLICDFGFEFDFD